jgi:hypothetical protein
VDRGPNTLKVIVPVGEDPPDRVPETDEDEIALPVVPVEGALIDSAGLAAGVSLSSTPFPRPEKSV